MTRDDPWSSGGEATRAEVREIFARHAAAHEQAAARESAAAEPPVRRAALPSLLRLPARGWRALGLPGRLAISALALALVALAALLVPPALDNASENRVNERRAQAANLERIRRELVAEQRPRRAVLSNGVATATALERAVSADAAGRVRRGTLDGPLGPTTCEPVRRSDIDPRAPVYTCLVEQGRRGEYPSRRGRPSRPLAPQGRALASGYRFRGRVVLAGGQAAWCKENPRPLHADQEEFVVVPLSRACTG